MTVKKEVGRIEHEEELKANEEELKRQEEVEENIFSDLELKLHSDLDQILNDSISKERKRDLDLVDHLNDSI